MNKKVITSLSDSIKRLSVFQHRNFSASQLERLTSWRDGISGLSPVVPPEQQIGQVRFSLLIVGVMVVGLVLLGRLFELQVVHGNEYQLRSERNRVYTKTIVPDRGVIYARGGEVLARNKPDFSLAIVYQEIPEEQMPLLKERLMVITQLTIDDLTERFNYARTQPYSQVILKRGISFDAQIKVKAEPEQFIGVHIISDARREYLLGDYFSVVLGYTGEISLDNLIASDNGKYVLGNLVGKTGIERQYEPILVGIPGKSIVEVDASGRVRQETSVTTAMAGHDLHLTIDAEVQQHLGDMVTLGLKEYDAWAGSAIIANVRTGEVLGMVSLPTYNNNVFNSTDGQALQNVLDDPRGLLINRAVSGLYPPGSTVKMAVGAEALQKGVITASTLVSSDPQVIRVGEWTFPDWTYTWGRGPYGMLDLPSAIAVSSDTFFYKVGGGYPPECKSLVWQGDATVSTGTACQVAGLGVDGLVQAFKMFGFGQPTGIDLPDEASGLVPNPVWKESVRGEAWFLGNTYHISIGQGDLLASPIQVLNLANIVATDDMTPRLHLLGNINEFAASSSSIAGLAQRDEKPVYLENLQVVREGMVKAVSQGIVYPLRGGVVKVAAKTGTAEFGTLNSKGEYDTHAWVVGFAPAENPQISFVFMLESGGGSSNTAALARKFVDWYFGEFIKK